MRPSGSYIARTIVREAVAVAAFGESCRDSGHALMSLTVQVFGVRRETGKE